MLCLSELLAMGVWFSASVVVPALTKIWMLDDDGKSWLTIFVQIGFVFREFISALLNIVNFIPTRYLFVASSILAALTTVLIPQMLLSWD